MGELHDIFEYKISMQSIIDPRWKFRDTADGEILVNWIHAMISNIFFFFSILFEIFLLIVLSLFIILSFVAISQGQYSKQGSFILCGDQSEIRHQRKYEEEGFQRRYRPNWSRISCPRISTRFIWSRLNIQKRNLSSLFLICVF